MMNSSLSSTPAPTSLHLHFAYWPTAKTTRARSLCVCVYVVVGCIGCVPEEKCFRFKVQTALVQLAVPPGRTILSTNRLEFSSSVVFHFSRTSIVEQSDTRTEESCRAKELLQSAQRGNRADWMVVFVLLLYFISRLLCGELFHTRPHSPHPHTHTMGAIIVSMRGLKSEDSCFAIPIDKRSVWQGKLWAMDEMCSMFCMSFGTEWADGRSENIFWRACK